MQIGNPIGDTLDPLENKTRNQCAGRRPHPLRQEKVAGRLFSQIGWDRDAGLGEEIEGGWSCLCLLRDVS